MTHTEYRMKYPFSLTTDGKGNPMVTEVLHAMIIDKVVDRAIQRVFDDPEANDGLYGNAAVQGAIAAVAAERSLANYSSDGFAEDIAEMDD